MSRELELENYKTKEEIQKLADRLATLRKSPQCVLPEPKNLSADKNYDFLPQVDRKILRHKCKLMLAQINNLKIDTFQGLPDDTDLHYHVMKEELLKCLSQYRECWAFLTSQKKEIKEEFERYSNALDHKTKSVHTRNYEYWKVVTESGVVVQQLCSVCIFVVVFILMDVKLLAAETLVTVSGCLTFCGYLLNCWLHRHNNKKRPYTDDLKTVLIFAGFSYCLSPVLESLTETIATDTIYAMTTVMLLANLCFHDYGADAEMVSGVLSLNAGLFASVCLASCLHTSLHSFATVTFAVEMFALWPALRRNLRQSIPSSYVPMTTTLSLLTLVTLTYISVTASVMLLVAIVFITFVCPAWLVSLQPYKNNIHGPWDEAVIKE